MTTYAVDIPAAYVDAFALASAPATPLVTLCNRNPEPNETNASLNTNIAISFAVVGPPITSLSVYVNGVLAASWNGSTTTFATGFDGAASAHDPTVSKTIVIDPTTPFASEEVVTVRVVGATSPSGTAFDTSYTFTCADVSSPIVASAIGTSLRTVRVTFSEAVRADGDGATADGLTPGNYTLAPLTFPAVTPTVTGVVPVTSDSVEISTDIELSPGRTYSVFVAHVVDRSPVENAVTAPFDFASFDAFVPAQPAGRDFDLYRMLPQANRRADQAGTRDLEKFIACLQEVTDLLLAKIDEFETIYDIDLAPEPFVDAMLVDLGNPFAFDDMALAEKRQLLAVLFEVYRQKGTGPGIVNVVRFFLGLEVTITQAALGGMRLGESELGFDWILGAAGSFAKYSFDVVSALALTAEQRTRIHALVEHMKPAHTHFVQLIEPVPPVFVDHMELGVSRLGESWLLH